MSKTTRWKRRCEGMSLSLAAFITFALLLAGCVSVPSPNPVPPLAPSVVKDPLDLVLVHTNDTWGYLTPCG